ncbi:MAG: hypothetical protein PVG12_08355 [Gammaproteobacteria bacterium]
MQFEFKPVADLLFVENHPRDFQRIAESIAMVCARFIGNDAAITTAGHFQLNVMLPLVAYHLLQSIDILSSAVPCSMSPAK